MPWRPGTLRVARAREYKCVPSDTRLDLWSKILVHEGGHVYSLGAVSTACLSGACGSFNRLPL